MTLWVGERVDAITRTYEGVDANGWPLYAESATLIEGVLVAPVTELSGVSESGTVASFDLYIRDHIATLGAGKDEVGIWGSRHQIDSVKNWNGDAQLRGSVIRVTRRLIDTCDVLRPGEPAIDDLGTAHARLVGVAIAVPCLVQTDTATSAHTQTGGESITPVTCRVGFADHGLRLGDQLKITAGHDRFLVDKMLTVTVIASEHEVRAVLV